MIAILFGIFFVCSMDLFNNNDGIIYNGTWPNYPVAIDQSGNGHVGTYTGVNLLSARAPGGGGSPFFDGVNDYVTINSVNPHIDLDRGSIMGWFKVENSGVWGDGITRTAIRFNNAIYEYVLLQKAAANNEIRFQRGADGVGQGISVACSEPGWVHAAGVWDASSDLLNLYLNASPGTPATGNHPIAGTVPTGSYIGIAALPASFLWQGWLAHMLILNRPATAGEIGKVYGWGV